MNHVLQTARIRFMLIQFSMFRLCVSFVIILYALAYLCTHHLDNSSPRWEFEDDDFDAMIRDKIVLKRSLCVNVPIYAYCLTTT